MHMPTARRDEIAGFYKVDRSIAYFLLKASFSQARQALRTNVQSLSTSLSHTFGDKYRL